MKSGEKIYFPCFYLEKYEISGEFRKIKLYGKTYFLFYK